ERDRLPDSMVTQMSTVTTLPVVDARRPSTLREPQGRPEHRRGATGSGRPQPVERGAPPWVQIVPGTILLAAVGFAGKIAEQSICAYGRPPQLPLPHIEYVQRAFVFGRFGHNPVGVPPLRLYGGDH